MYPSFFLSQISWNNRKKHWKFRKLAYAKIGRALPKFPSCVYQRAYGFETLKKSLDTETSEVRFVKQTGEMKNKHTDTYINHPILRRVGVRAAHVQPISIPHWLDHPYVIPAVEVLRKKGKENWISHGYVRRNMATVAWKGEGQVFRCVDTDFSENYTERDREAKGSTVADHVAPRVFRCELARGK